MTAHATARPIQISHRPPDPRQCALAGLDVGGDGLAGSAPSSAESTSSRSRSALRTITPPSAPAFALARARRINRRRDVLDADHSGVKRPATPADAPAGAKARSFAAANSVMTSVSGHAYGPAIRCGRGAPRDDVAAEATSEADHAGRPGCRRAAAWSTAGLPGAGKTPRVTKEPRAAGHACSSSVTGERCDMGCPLLVVRRAGRHVLTEQPTRWL